MTKIPMPDSLCSHAARRAPAGPATPRLPRRSVACRLQTLLQICGALAFQALCVASLPAEGAPPLPEWIWIEGDDSGSGTVEFERRFELGPNAVSASLRLAADFARVEVELNGTTACVLEDYGPWATLDVRPHLRNGMNHLLLRCTPSEGPSAVLCELAVAWDDTSVQRISSDAHWSARRHPASSAFAGSARAVSYGVVAPYLWGVDVRSAQITPFDDYEQWRRALDAGAEPQAFELPEGFDIERLRSADPEEGSWISLEFDPQGRLLVAREDQGLLRFTIDGESVERVEPVAAAAELLECRGLAFLGPDLYVNANNSKGLYRLRDLNADGEFDETTLLREFPGGVGHGRNDLSAHGGALYSIHGDSVDLPTTDVEDLTSPARAARQGEKTSEGQLLKYQPEDDRWTLIAAGLRNPFGVALHPVDGTAFTYDADAEHDMGAPWYRPTRIVQMLPGADYGWRGVTGQWPPYFPDRADNALPVMDIGKGSPTAVKFGTPGGFPAPFRDALFVLDWAYGRILAVHLLPRGAGYAGRSQVFLRGRPLNVTDLEFGPDGAMYLVTGGRKTQSALYRVRYTGPAEPAPADALAERRADFARADRQRLEAIEECLAEDCQGSLGDVARRAGWLNPVLAAATRTVLERSLASASTPDWVEAAFSLEEPLAALNNLLALARAGNPLYSDRILNRLNEFDLGAMTTTEKLLALRTYAVCLERASPLSDSTRAACRERLDRLYPDRAPPAFVPPGLGGPVNHRLAELLVRLEAPEVVDRTLPLLNAATAQEDRLFFLFVLRNVKSGWALPQRAAYFRALNDLERQFHGGRGMPAFLKAVRDDALAALSTLERQELAGLLEPPGPPAEEPLPQRAHVREWNWNELTSEPSGPRTPDVERGRELFREALCSRCHRCGEIGSAVGPDLTSIGGRFSRQDILRSILEPSAVVAENYRNVEIVTKEGRVLIGQLLTTGDYRDSVLRIQTDPLRPSQVVELPKSEVELHREGETSPMPAGLLNTLNRAEIEDLLSFLLAGGGGQPAASR